MCSYFSEDCFDDGYVRLIVCVNIKAMGELALESLPRIGNIPARDQTTLDRRRIFIIHLTCVLDYIER